MLIDGSYHTVDSDEHSFRAAGRKAFRAAIEKVRPTMLEPIMDVEVVAPAGGSGDIMGDLNSRRGRVQGMDSAARIRSIKAQVPDVRDARLSIEIELDHRRARLVSHAVLALRSRSRTDSHKIVEQAKAEGRIRAEEEE